MFITECDCDEVKKEASKLLKSFEIKHRLKKIELKHSDKKVGDGVFNIRLERLRQKRVKLLQYDQPVGVPAFLVDSCEYLRDRIDTDGLFRKPGVMMRQKELKKMLVSGGRLAAECDHSSADVADLLKLFFRELPEPCIPFFFHDILQRCLEIKPEDKMREAIFITLLLLPSEYLYTLAYLIQFLREVAAHHQTNRMDISNLAIVWTPNLMPFKTGQVSDKPALNKRLTITQILIEHSQLVGVVPDCIQEQLSYLPSSSMSSHDDLESSRHRDRKKKRRSSSLTRMISGIRRMVQKSGSEEHGPEQVTPEPTHTPRIICTGSKRKASESNLLSFSAKKRRDLLECLPQGHLLPNVCSATHLTPRILSVQLGIKVNSHEEVPKRRSRFYTYSKSPEREQKPKPNRSTSGSRLRLSHFGIGKKTKTKSLVSEESGQELSETPNTLDLTTSPEDYVRVPRGEYEEIKNRMSIIESRISCEFENIIGVSISDLEVSPETSVTGRLQTVQSAYERTLESSGKFNSPTSDELARRFSKELKIRGSSEKRVIRSPSARKIGSLRRRSKENIPEIKRNLSLNTADRSHHFYPTRSLRRGRPNTVSSGLPELLSLDSTKSYLKNLTNQLKLETFESPRRSFGEERIVNKPSELDFNINNFGMLTRSQARRASSFHGCTTGHILDSSLTNKEIDNVEIKEKTQWRSAEDFLDKEKTEGQAVTGRPSVAKLRSQNAGMVLAKAKMFSTMVTLDQPDKKPNTQKEKPSRELKKRNSSKSSKERKLQRKDSSRSNRRGKADTIVSKENVYFSSPLSRERTPGLSQRQARCYNESLNKNSKTSKSVPDSINKTSLQNGKLIQKSSRESYNYKVELGKNLGHVHSPLRDINRCHSLPVSARLAHHSVPAKASYEITNDGRKTPRTPRKSPRQTLLKSPHISKHCN